MPPCVRKAYDIRSISPSRIAPGFNLLPGHGVDHFAVVVRDFFMQALWGIGDEIAVLEDGAVLISTRN